MTVVIAASRLWDPALPARIEAQSGQKVVLLRDKAELSKEHLREIAPDYVFFPHWSYKIPTEIFNAYECVIFHMTDVPFGRGGSPLQNLVVRGIYETKISALKS